MVHTYIISIAIICNLFSWIHISSASEPTQTFTVTTPDAFGSGSFADLFSQITWNSPFSFPPPPSGPVIFNFSNTLTGNILIGGMQHLTNLAGSASYPNGAFIVNGFGVTSNPLVGVIPYNSHQGFLSCFGPIPDIIINSLKMQDFSSSNHGGAIYSTGPVSVTNTVFIENHTAGYGAAIGNNGAITIKDSIFDGNSSAASGGSLSSKVRVTAYNSSFLNNTAGESGGVSISTGFSGENLIFRGNKALGDGMFRNVPIGIGGSIFNTADSVVINNSIFENNEANQSGGAIYSMGDSFITDTRFIDNIALNGVGGAIYQQGSSTVHFTTSTQDISLDPKSGGPTAGNNDIASHRDANFVKQGPKILTLNTRNSNWLGRTEVQEGTMLVGGTASNTDAIWSQIDGSNSIQVNATPDSLSETTLGGFGRIYGSTMMFSEGSTFWAGLTSPNKDPILNARDTITLQPNVKLVVDPAHEPVVDTLYTVGHTSNSISGTFSYTTINPLNAYYTLYTAEAIYTSNQLQVKFKRTPVHTGDSASQIAEAILFSLSDIKTSALDAQNPDDTFMPTSTFFIPKSYPSYGQRYSTAPSLLCGPPSSPLETITQMMIQTGPIIRGIHETRLWVCPYYNQGNTEAFDDQPSVKDHFTGILMGIEKRSIQDNWTVGSLIGVGMGHTRLPQFRQTQIDERNGIAGLYHSLGFLEHARYDVELMGILSHHNLQRSERFGNPVHYLALGSYKSFALSANGEVSYQFKITPSFSVRPSMGYNYAQTNQDGYTERNALYHNRIVRPVHTHKKEVFSGIGIRKSYKTEQFEIKLTGLWEQGYELTSQITNRYVSSVQTPNNIVHFSIPGNGRHLTYLTCYASILNKRNHIKVLGGYKATLQKHRNHHTINVKVEYRF